MVSSHKHKLNKTIGEIIRKLRQHKGLTQEEFAEAAGIHEKHVGRIERGIQGMSIEYLFKVAQGFNMKVSELVRVFFDEEEETDDDEKLLQEIHTMLRSQSHINLKLLKRLLIQLPPVFTEEKATPKKKQKTQK